MARYRDSAGREYFEMFDTEKQAKTFIAMTKSVIRRDTWTDPTSQKITVAQLMTRWAD